jgi:hypothetical protein
MQTPLERVTKDIEKVEKKIEVAELELKDAKDQLKAAVLAREPADILQSLQSLLGAAKEELHDLREEKGKLIERQTALETSNSTDNELLHELIPLVKEQTLLSKRFMDEAAENETTSSKRSKTAQDAFRSRVEERDKKCKISGSATYEACHIVPYIFYSKYPAIWNDLFKKSCLVAAHKVDDIRNGLLLNKKWHTHFDAFRITITFSNGKYKVKSCTWFQFADEDEALLEKELVFGSKKGRWPGKDFLDFHNKQFDERELMEAMKAKAEDVNLPSHDSNDTIALKLGSDDYHILDWADKVDHTGFSSYLDIMTPDMG